MPMWAPPTPPQDDNDLYLDQTMCFLYEPSVMSESQLPPVYVKKEHKRVRIDSTIAAARKMKVRKDEQPRVPRSLFDRPMTAIRRDTKLLKLRQQTMAGLKPGFQKPQPSLIQNRPMIGEPQTEWLVHEDWALLQALQTLQELPLGLQGNSPAHIPNWDMVADVVNACSRTYRSSKQCRNRYDTVIVPREEGKILYDINPRKQKKTKGIYKTKNNRPMRTSQIHAQDNNGALTTLFTLRFDSVKSIGSKRTPTLRPTLANPTLRNPKHAAVLAEGGISYEKPKNPVEVAAIRADRMAKEKKQTPGIDQKQQMRATVQQAVKLPTPQPTGQPQVASTVTQVVTGSVSNTSVAPMTIVQQGSQLQHVVSSSAAVISGSLQKAVPGAAVAAVARSLGTGSSIVVNTGNAGFSQINKRMGQAVVQGTPLAQSIPTTLTTSTVAQAIQRQGRTTTGLTVQELQAVVNRNPAIRAATLGTTTLPTGTQVLTTTTLTPAQLMAAQKAGTVTVTSVAGGTIQQQLAQVPAKKLTQQQLVQFTRQQAILKQQQQLRQNPGQPTNITALQQQTTSSIGTTVQAIQKTVAVTTPLITSITQVSGSQGHLQVAKSGLKPIVTEEMAALLKRQQLQQQGKVLATASGQPVQVSQGQLTRLTAAQIISGPQVQQVAGQASGQPVTAAIVKTMAPQQNVPLSLGISVNMPQQKGVKASQVQAIRFQQHPQAQQPRKASITQHQQKVAALQQLAKAGGGSTPLLIPPQQQPGLHKVMVQQVMVKQPVSGASSQAPTIQQIVTTPLQTTASSVVTTQIVSQQRPAVTLTTALPQQTRTTSVSSSGGTSLVSHPMSLPQGTTLVKTVQQVQELVGGSPQAKTTALSPQVKAVQQVTTVRQLPSAAQSVQVLQQPGQQQATVVKQMSTPTTNVQQAVQQVLQQAQSQVVQQARPVVVSSSASVQASSPQVSAQQVVTPVAISAGQQQLVTGNVQQQQAQGGDKSPYAMRLRNQRS